MRSLSSLSGRREVVPQRGEDRAAIEITEHPMFDIALLGVGAGFFALTIGYCFACDRL